MIKGRKKLNNIIHSKTKLGQGNKSEIDSESKEYRNTTKLKIQFSIEVGFKLLEHWFYFRINKFKDGTFDFRYRRLKRN